MQKVEESDSFSNRQMPAIYQKFFREGQILFLEDCEEDYLFSVSLACF